MFAGVLPYLGAFGTIASLHGEKDVSTQSGATITSSSESGASQGACEMKTIHNGSLSHHLRRPAANKS